MKNARTHFLLAAALMVGAPLTAQQPMPGMTPPPAPDEVPEATPEMLEAIGYAMAQNSFFSFGFTEEELEAILSGVRAAVLGGEEPANLEATLQEAEAYMRAKAAAFQAEQQLLQDAEADLNIQEGEKFLAELRDANPNIQQTESGLHYEIVEEGTGKQPEAADRVRLHYVGTFMNGEVFDSSRERGEPAVFPLRGVVPGFSEGLQLLNEGAKAKLYLPAEIAYGKQGSGPIPPGQLLIFDVELIEVIEPAPRRTVTSPPIEVPARGEGLPTEGETTSSDEEGHEGHDHGDHEGHSH